MAKKFTMHVDVDAFIPATDEEKAYMVQMRPSSTFFRDGMKRLFKNKIATISLILIIVITLASIVVPMFWPYSYENMLGVNPGKPVDASYNNLAPFTYGKTELQQIEAGRRSFPISSVPIPPGATTLSAWSTARGYRLPSVFLPASSSLSSA